MGEFLIYIMRTAACSIRMHAAVVFRINNASGREDLFHENFLAVDDIKTAHGVHDATAGEIVDHSLGVFFHCFDLFYGCGGFEHIFSYGFHTDHAKVFFERTEQTHFLAEDVFIGLKAECGAHVASGQLHSHALGVVCFGSGSGFGPADGG